MVKLFLQGEPLYMTALSMILVFIISFCLIEIKPRQISIKRITVNDQRLKTIKSLGLFALIFGLFTQFLGLYGALQAIEIWGQVESKHLFDGIGISFIPMGYGLIIFLTSRIIIYGVTKRIRLQG
ncbi:hypothetical protein [Roseivirga misakiensis]|uniref:MotA/TolQ/ExbB proton channel domain-containing protein n=1 Tax=Roseivirga misakiensis TaxID=1563681 RepID=A0A1E5SZ58_9BACT|nr:hypothetical protein [Roseivirga misakiensis]OEK04402.1 hypothetical protein BFP71_13050 [Roseivirga misakiensis]